MMIYKLQDGAIYTIYFKKKTLSNMWTSHKHFKNAPPPIKTCIFDDFLYLSHSVLLAYLLKIRINSPSQSWRNLEFFNNRYFFAYIITIRGHKHEFTWSISKWVEQFFWGSFPKWPPLYSKLLEKRIIMDIK